jgi:hypothetical protein
MPSAKRTSRVYCAATDVATPYEAHGPAIRICLPRWRGIASQRDWAFLTTNELRTERRLAFDAAVGGTTRALGSLRAYLVVTTTCLCSALANPFQRQQSAKSPPSPEQWVSCGVRGGQLSAKQNTDASAA